MEAPSMDTVYQAISALYDNPNANEKEKASLWLGDVQKSIHSWKISDQLLQEKKDEQSYYFAAQTMRSKVQHNLSELPPESLVSLRDSLIAHLENAAAGTSNAILTQLSLALADLALQMQTWQNCVSDLIKLFSTKNEFALLEILTVLPQEIDSPNLKLGENRREEIKNELRANSNLVCLFLKESIANSQNSQISLKIVKCMTSWIQVRAVNIDEVPQNAVIGFCLQVLRDHNSINLLHDAASDCICALLHCLEENNNNEDIERLLFDSIASLEESYHMAVAHEEEEKAVNYAKVFTELAETFLEKIVFCTASGRVHFAMRSLELALVCVGHHDYEVAEITFNLWYRLSEEVYQRDQQPLTDAFKPHIERLIEALARHCQLEPDNTKLPDEGDEFYEFRMKVMELIKDVVFMVGSSAVFRQMFAALQADCSWEHTEAALFIMQAVAKNILPDEEEYVPKVVEAILSMPAESHVAVRRTCILLLGELCEWVERHPACLQPCLHALLHALHHPSLAPAAAQALQSICKACRTQASAHVDTLVAAARTADTASQPLAGTAGATLLRALAAPHAAQPLLQLLHALLPPALALLQAHNGLQDNPDTVDDLFRLCIRYLQHIPVAFLSSGAAPSVLQCAALASRLDHREANSSVMKFLGDLLRCANDIPADATPEKQQIKSLADSALSQYGEQLTCALVEAAALHLHAYMLSEVGEVVLELMRWARAHGADWLRPALARLPRDTERAAAPTDNQCWQFHQYALRAEKCKEMTRLLLRKQQSGE
ncbi:PREDICTED: importin-13 [Papilio xuthus]|uniref:Importin-13 n=1 Tax=Papilio xuthus TaxID=66420 RepID=A0AAJ7EFM5_PAPXU|nr:PREDICTED: importin-13 [Papilio xuthus]